LAAAYGTGCDDPGFDRRADFDLNGQINIADFGLLTLFYGQSGPLER